jgi:predicted RNA-binding protein with RPS1 domain
MILPGNVSSIVDFGAFVDLGGIDGLVHISELSWSHVNHPSEVVKVGDPVNVQVLDVDLSRERISLGLKQTTEDPWKQLVKNFPIGSIIEGTVTKLVPFGAFVELGDGVEGLVHISEMAKGHVETPDQVTSVGQKVHVKVMDVDEERRRISLSMRSAAETLGFEIEITGLPEGEEGADGDETDSDDVEIVAIDIDGDGVADAVVVTEAVDIDGDGEDDAVMVTTVADVDGDGTPDVVDIVEVVDTDGDGEPDTVIEILAEIIEDEPAAEEAAEEAEDEPAAEEVAEEVAEEPAAEEAAEEVAEEPAAEEAAEEAEDEPAAEEVAEEVADEPAAEEAAEEVADEPAAEEAADEEKSE